MFDITYCYECGKETPYTVAAEPATYTFRGGEVEYMETVARCDVCGDDIGFVKFLNANHEARYKACRQKHGIIPPERIKEMPEMYGLTARQFARLISMDERWFLHYCETDVPTRDIAALFRRLHGDPCYYLEVLEANKHHIGMKAYAKSKETVLKMLEGTERYPASLGNFRELMDKIDANESGGNR
jgi:hypothetical protein